MPPIMFKDLFRCYFFRTELHSSQWWLPKLSAESALRQSHPHPAAPMYGCVEVRGSMECIAPWSDASLMPMLNGTFSSTNLPLAMIQPLSHVWVEHAAVQAQPPAFVPCSSSHVEGQVRWLHSHHTQDTGATSSSLHRTTPAPGAYT